MGMSREEIEQALDALGEEPTCVFLSVEAEVDDLDPLSEKRTRPGLRIVHVHADDYDGPCLPTTGHVPGQYTEWLSPATDAEKGS